jgi:putative transposase
LYLPLAKGEVSSPGSTKKNYTSIFTGLVQNRNAKMLAVHCMPDHVHLFVGFKPTIPISDFVKEIKVESNQFINSKKWVDGKFNWQEGYGVFSYSRSHVDTVVKYVLNQEEHHRSKSFKVEYFEFLKKFNVTFDEKYAFDFVQNNGDVLGSSYGA